jgi:predicted N-acetyltransferase YhbS
MWYDRDTDYCIIEPLATDPDYRRMGLGKAVVLEGIRRCAVLGVKVAYVGSEQEFYYRTGFKPLQASRWWEKDNY